MKAIPSLAWLTLRRRNYPSLGTSDSKLYHHWGKPWWSEEHVRGFSKSVQARGRTWANDTEGQMIVGTRARAEEWNFPSWESSHPLTLQPTKITRIPQQRWSRNVTLCSSNLQILQITLQYRTHELFPLRAYPPLKSTGRKPSLGPWLGPWWGYLVFAQGTFHVHAVYVDRKVLGHRFLDFDI